MKQLREVAAQCSQLPVPDAFAQAHSRALFEVIADEIEAEGGSISFARFMALALYAPGLGYYAAGAQKFGEAGDFVTAPEISPLFSHCLAHQAAQVLRALGGGDILEYGAGSGVMALEILRELARIDCLPDHYYIMELSADLRQRQHQRLREDAPQLLERVVWLDALPEVPINGVVFANEVLDAMPINLFEVQEGVLQEVNVMLGEQGLTYALDEVGESLASAATLVELAKQRPDGYRSEYNAAVGPWLQSMAGSLGKAAVFLIDYGYPQHEFYHPQRSGGSLMCHYRHRSHADPLILLGLQDITAHVDFTQVAEEACRASFDVSGFTSQAYFLMSLGLTERLADNDPDDIKQQMLIAQQVKKLTMPNEMGELFKVIALQKGLGLPLQGFMMNDQRSRL
ncbi:MAG: SAM-dependent methyltransferase [Gammaproteobacteria bacterium]|nr:SAM-dependent methyltransferase [Gammaproteobacteria bacterium]MCF6231401.1 SAM-dependent methyltransferase [Gammaproteobacteria bacterium]